MILDAGTETALLDWLKGQGLEAPRVQPALTYLANVIAVGDREIPYSTVTATDFSAKEPLGPMLRTDGARLGPLADNQIVLNSWAAEDLQASVGDLVRVTYFEPESTEGKVQEQRCEFRLAAIAQLAGAAADPALTPQVPGVTDQRSIADWNPPFPFDAKRIREKDEKYWDEHRATPKAFVSLAAGRKLWGSRFGRTTSLRVVPDEATTPESLEKKVDLDPVALGFVFQPVKRQALAASAGTTPFNVLFLSFSFFVIAAAAMLVALLFRLGIDQRATQIGTLLALGIGRRGTSRLLVAEGLLLAAAAGVLGVVLGIGYAALMLTGLRTESWWLAAVVTPFLRLHVSCPTLVAGYASGLVLALATIAWSVWRTRRLAVRQLLAGRPFEESPLIAVTGHRSSWAVWVLLVGAIVLGLGAAMMGEEARAGAFFGAGAMVLTASLVWTRKRLKSGATGAAVAPGRGNLARMAARNAARNPGRSTLSIGLVAATAFLIIAISAFHLDPTGKTPELAGGDGGFALVAESDQPVYYDLNTSEGRFDLGFAPDDSDRLGRATLYSVRVKPGDDASCLNLYQPRQPRILGLPDSLIDRGGFAWAKTAAETPQEQANPWLLLEKKLPPDADGTARVPVVIDMATAMYSLHLYRGVGETYDVTDRAGRTVRLEVVGLLKNSIFQGDLLIGERALLEHFPEVGGYRFFLVEAPLDETTAGAGALEGTLGDWGLATETTGARLARFLAVQNTYLSTFQSLGALGLLLGTFGLAAVQLRAVLERRGELALLRATGFRRRSLAWLVMVENSFLLLAGLACGVLAALVAVLPHLVTRSATIPWSSLAGALAVILIVGLLAGLTAVRAVLRAPLVAALRGE
jgi:ABC-type lipoprotein release transport system permease subunit